DTAMYHAKAAGRGTWSLFDEEMSLHADRRLEMENDLRAAVGRGELLVQFQPLVAVDGAGVIGFEALARWSHPVRGLIPPRDFIPPAEGTGLVVPVGRWVLREACQYAASWRRLLPENPVFVSVN